MFWGCLKNIKIMMAEVSQAREGTSFYDEEEHIVNIDFLKARSTPNP